MTSHVMVNLPKHVYNWDFNQPGYFLIHDESQDVIVFVNENNNFTGYSETLAAAKSSLPAQKHRSFYCYDEGDHPIEWLLSETFKANRQDKVKIVGMSNNYFERWQPMINRCAAELNLYSTITQLYGRVNISFKAVQAFLGLSNRQLSMEDDEETMDRELDDEETMEHET